MRGRMNVYLTTGKKNYKYAYVAIQSLFEHNRNSEIYLYIVSEDLEEKDLPYEYALAKQFGNHIIILRFDEKRAGGQIKLQKGDHWVIGTMSSYWLFHELLPKEVDRIIMIESDTVVVGDLSEIYQMDFGDNYVICPGPEHKPKNHREFMESIGGECLTFVLSMYDVERIRRDFTLEDILQTDVDIRAKAGNSMMELVFGKLFTGRIKFVPGKDSCIDENERYIEELGYDYLAECEKTAKIIHFSSYSDYSKPWNPVFLVPGYAVWWKYAVNSPYYKEYIERQWQYYHNTRQRQKKIAKNISYRNILIAALVIMTVMLSGISICAGAGLVGTLVIVGCAVLSVCAAILVRRVSMLAGKWGEYAKCRRT
ncbi:MAG: hypothetical protein LUI12_11495 [Clostridiales bacterium]|nr:hypothetical protein [Clostridiales bacterium]